MAKELLSLIRNIIDDDLVYLSGHSKRPKKVGTGAGNVKRDQGIKKDCEEFAAYLAAVASQSIGLRASVSPFNESSESMLAYLMDVFRLNEAQLESIIAESSGGSYSTDDKRKPTVTARLNKICHKWQPELKLRIDPPIILNERTEDLTVRIYQFKENTLHDVNRQRAQKNLIQGSKNIYDVIKVCGSGSPKSTRPRSELLIEAKFVKSDETYRLVRTSPAQGGTNSRLVHLVGQRDNEIRIVVPKQRSRSNATAYFLDIEFWLQEDKVFGLRTMKRFIDCTRVSCCGGRSKTSTPVHYSAYGKQFYGFVSIRLDQIPAYATKSSYHIQSPQFKPINSCEICLEFINKDLLDLNEEHTINEIIIKHARLYAICIAYQLSILTATNIFIDEFAFGQTQSTLSLDNLLYMPAFSLINQHRLQNNLSQLEDQSIRRSSILLLLLCLTRRHDISLLPESHKILLMSMAEHDYLNAHRQFNNAIGQEVETFHRGATLDRSHEKIKMLEHDAIQNFVDELVSSNRIRIWLSKIDSTNIELAKQDVLSSLRLAKTILAHHDSNPMVDSILKYQSSVLRDRINKLLADIVSDELRLRLNTIISSNKTSQSPKYTRRSKLNKERSTQSTQMSSWQKFFYDLHMLENDIILNWSNEGLDCLRLQQFKGESSFINDESIKKLRKNIQDKINDYLASKS
jgi:hypothetical protein